MGYKSDLIDLEVIFKHQTDKAVLVCATETDSAVWIPKYHPEILGLTVWSE